MNKFLIVLALATCTTTLTFASSKWAEPHISLASKEETVLQRLELSAPKEKAVREALLDSEKQKRLVIRHAREQLRQLETAKASKLSGILTEQELESFIDIEARMREERLDKFKTGNVDQLSFNQQ